MRVSRSTVLNGVAEARAETTALKAVAEKTPFISKCDGEMCVYDIE